MTRFYIKGSYVLDFVFGRVNARDIDVFYRRGAQPTRAEVIEWIREHELPAIEAVDPTAVDDMDSCTGGAGHPFFNIDRWHIRDDGKLYTLEETSIASSKLEVVLHGAPDYETQVVPLARDDARRTSVEIIRPLEDLPPEPESLEFLHKVLRKMREHPELANPVVERHVTEEASRRA